jgi:ribA/ribD-fused uncharacterized protein
VDRAELIARVKDGETPEYLFFWGHRQKRDGIVDASCLSQWFPAAFEVEGERFTTAEHWMMAGKARLFGDAEMRAKIMAASDPKTAKGLGRKVRGFDEVEWKAVRYDLVVDGNVHKFGAHPKMRAFLVGTGEKILVEASPYDRIWGIGLGRDAEGAKDPELWRGDNLLGFALMDVRARLKR